MKWPSWLGGSTSQPTGSPEPTDSTRETDQRVFLDDLQNQTSYTPGQGAIVNPNRLPGKEVTPEEAQDLLNIGTKDFQNVLTIPCFRNAMLVGISTLTVMSGVMIAMRQPVMKACNWGVGSFTLGSVASWEHCRYKRRQELKLAEMANSLPTKVKPANKG